MNTSSRKVVVTGGAGYVGSLLVPELLKQGFKVVVYDTFWFGNDFLPKSSSSLSLVKGDIRDSKLFGETAKDAEAVIHMACISNDASFELDESLSTSVNLNAFEPLVVAAKKAGVKRFIYASSSSVYGVSEDPNVTEEHPLVPLTLYNKYKGECEPILLSHKSKDFEVVVIRPATLCGYAPRQRLDLSVNILTNHAVNSGVIKVFGGAQMRPNLHIKDMADLYIKLLDAHGDLINGEIFNASKENMSILEISKLVKKVVETRYPNRGELDIEIVPSSDNRSYHVNSEKIKRILNFTPRFTVEDAIIDLCTAFDQSKLPNSMSDSRYFNVMRMKELRVE